MYLTERSFRNERKHITVDKRKLRDFTPILPTLYEILQGTLWIERKEHSIVTQNRVKIQHLKINTDGNIGKHYFVNLICNCTWLVSCRM